MLRILFSFMLLSGVLFSSTNFTIKIAVFKTQKKIQKALDKFPPALKTTTRTYTYNKQIHVYTIPTRNREILETLLPAYQKFFSDAYIAQTERDN